MKIRHNKNPRETVVEFEGWSTGVRLCIGRNGVAVDGHYDTFVGIRGGFITWAEFDEFRKQAEGTFKEATK